MTTAATKSAPKVFPRHQPGEPARAGVIPTHRLGLPPIRNLIRCRSLSTRTSGSDLSAPGSGGMTSASESFPARAGRQISCRLPHPDRRPVIPHERRILTVSQRDGLECRFSSPHEGSASRLAGTDDGIAASPHAGDPLLLAGAAWQLPRVFPVVWRGPFLKRGAEPGLMTTVFCLFQGWLLSG